MRRSATPGCAFDQKLVAVFDFLSNFVAITTMARSSVA